MEQKKDRLVYICGNRKIEGVALEGRIYYVQPCTIAKYIIEVPEAFWGDVAEVAEKAKRFLTNSMMLPDSRVLNAIVELRTIRELAAPELLKDLALFLPAMAGHQEVRHKMQRVEMSLSERKEVNDKVFGVGRSVVESARDMEEAVDRMRQMNKYLFPENAWWQLISFLDCKEDRQSIANVIAGPRVAEEYIGFIREYCEELLMLPVEAKKLKREICRAVGIFPAGLDFVARHQALEELIDGPLFQISGDTQAEKFPDYKMRESERVYGAVSLSALISLEMQMLEKYSYEFKKCAFCGGYFATSDARAKYCGYKEYPECKGKTCKEAAPQIVYERKDDLGKLRREARDAYKHWVERTTEQDEAKKYLYIKEIERLMRHENKGRDIAKLQKELFDDVWSAFEKWDKNTKEMLKKYGNEEISEEECRRAFEIPEERERSKTLSEWKSRITGE